MSKKSSKNIIHFLLELHKFDSCPNNKSKLNKKPKRLENSQLSKAAEGVLRNRCSRGVLSLEN